MQSFLLQDWTTVRGTGTTPVVQDSAAWLDLERFADVTLWIEVRNVTNPGTGAVTMALETAPAAIDALFQPLDVVDTVKSSSTPLVRKVFLNETAGIPLARYVRWNLFGTASGAWDVTFRVHVTAGFGTRNVWSPLDLPGLVLWLRADQGVTLTSGVVTLWRDLSGNGNDVSQAVTANAPSLALESIGRRRALDFTGGKWMENTASNLGLGTGGQPYSVLTVAKQGNGALFTLRRGTTYSASKFHTATTYVHGDGVNSFANVTVPDTTATTLSATTGFKSCHAYTGSAFNPAVYLNGASLSTSVGTHQTTENGTTGFQVGTDGATEAWSGAIAELIVTTQAISNTDRVRVENYQKYFFGI